MHGVQLREKGLALRLDRASRGTKPLPQIVPLRLGEACAVVLMFLPPREDVVESSAGLLPLNLLRILRGHRLCLDNEGFALGQSRSDYCLLLGGLFLGDFLDRPAQRIEAGAQRCQVTHGVGRGDCGLQRRDGLGDIRHRSPTLDALFEQSDLAREFGEFSLEIAEGLFRRSVGVLPDGAFSTSCVAHKDGSRRIDAAPRRQIVHRHNHHLAV